MRFSLSDVVSVEEGFLMEPMIGKKQNISMTTPPNIYEYVDIKNFLDDYYQHLKAAQKVSSLSRWSVELGFDNRDYLRLIITGKRNISEHSLELFLKWFPFSKEEKEQFRVLVMYTQSKSSENRTHYGKLLMNKLKIQQTMHDVLDPDTYLSSPNIPKIRVLLTLEDLKLTPEYIASMLNLDEVEVRYCLETLRKMGLAQETIYSDADPTIVWRSRELFHVKDRPSNEAMKKLTRKSLEEALVSTQLQEDIRKYLHLIVPLNRDQYLEFVKETDNFIKQSLAKYGLDQGHNTKLYQMTIALFPISNDLKKKSEKES